MERLKLGRCYTRRQIHEIRGGSLQEYLPHVSKKVVCGCVVPKRSPTTARLHTR